VEEGHVSKYRGEEKSRGRRKGWGKGRVIGWIATRTWYTIARLLITVKDYYLLGIIRTVAEEVEGIERVTLVLIGLIGPRGSGKVSSGW
jgi:hypothetical protein